VANHFWGHEDVGDESLDKTEIATYEESWLKKKNSFE